jgi:hypothetical protein
MPVNTRLKEIQYIDGVAFTARRLDRLERAQTKTVYYAVIRRMETDSPGAYLDEADVYASIVVGTKIETPLPTMDGDVWVAPPITADDETHYASFLKFCTVDPVLTDAIIAVVNRVNAPQVPSHIKPPEQLTEADKAQPNFTNGDGATSSG